MGLEKIDTAYVGIDVSSDKLDVCILPGKEQFTVRLDEQGLTNLRERMVSLQPKLVVLEATGGYEQMVVADLHGANIPIRVVNARWVRDFAKSRGILAKTDRIDAKVLALYASKSDLEIRPIPDAQQRLLTEMVTRRHQLVTMRTMEMHRSRQARNVPVRKSVEAIIEALNAQIKGLEEQITTLIRSTPIWCEKDKVMRSVPGVGPVVSFSMLAYMPEVGDMNRRETASLTGVAPFNRDSGQNQGKRSIWGGRPRIREVLYMSIVSAMTHNPILKTFCARLSAGKPKKVAMTAGVRKLVTILNTMVKNNTTWNPEFAMKTT